MRLEPEDERSKGLRAKRLHREDEGEEEGFPARQEAGEGLERVGFAFGDAAG